MSVEALGGLLLGRVRVVVPTWLLRVWRWYQDLTRLGVRPPFYVVHDIGLLFAAPREQFSVGPRPGLADATGPGRLAELAAAYGALIAELDESDTSARARSLRLSDDLVVVLLARLLGPVPGFSGVFAEPPPLDPGVLSALESDVPRLWGMVSRAAEWGALEALLGHRLHLLTRADALDVDTLRLMGLFVPDSAASLAHADMLAALGSPETNDIVSFSLELLPTLLEARRKGAQGTWSMDGYAGLGTRGSLDSLVPTELAWDETELTRRMLEGELLYYTREQALEPGRRLHMVLIDGSASMRGDRSVFARGLALALGARLTLGGEEVWFRFFDSRLYEVHRARARTLPAAYLLAFRGERGRNPSRVFAELATELGLRCRAGQATRESDVVLHILTHAAFSIPRALVEELRTRARVFAVFLQPSGGALDLDYLDLLDGHVVVDHGALQEKGARIAAASKIVDAATQLRHLKG